MGLWFFQGRLMTKISTSLVLDYLRKWDVVIFVEGVFLLPKAQMPIRYLLSLRLLLSGWNLRMSIPGSSL